MNALGCLRIMFAVDDIDETLDRLRKRGAQLIGEVIRYQDSHRLATSAGLKGRGHTKDTITNKRDQLASSDTLPEDNKERWASPIARSDAQHRKR